MEQQRSAYRNAVRSRTLIRNAFLQLMRETDVRKIKVKDIIALSGVSKGTFYAHYENTYAVFSDVEAEYVARLFKIFHNCTRQIQAEDMLPLFLKGLEEIETDREIFHILFRSEHGGTFAVKIRQQLLALMTRHANTERRSIDMNRARGFLMFAVGGVVSLIDEWLGTPDAIPCQTCAAFLTDCVLRGVQAVHPQP